MSPHRIAHTGFPRARAQTPGGMIAYTRTGSGPPVLLIHGLGGTRTTWNHVIGDLSRTHTVIAADLPGHGESEAPAGDYSLGAHAAAMRDLLDVLEISRTSVIGHSLGGGIAMQFAYQFPERTERLVLIGSGGLGPEISWLLRAASMTPGAGLVLNGLARVPVQITRAVLATAAVPGIVSPEDTASLVVTLRGLAGSRQRQTFLKTAQSVIDWRGQRVSAVRLLALLDNVPVLLIWGSRDKIIPPAHHAAMAARISRAQLLEVPNAGHFPHETEPGVVVPAITAFLLARAPVTSRRARPSERAKLIPDSSQG